MMPSMALPDPTVLSETTRFRPAHFRTHSRSPSRSPVRKAKFTSQHLDPLLSNLSPESTLRALQATHTIPAGSTSTEDVLGKSIADATPEEREIGIRAAFAAQKLKEWRREISRWQWPNRRDRAYGAGFLDPDGTDGETGTKADDVYLGSLPLRLLNQYSEKIEDIKDGLESLELEDLKDHVLTAHATHNAPPTSVSASGGTRTSYGRMRDFTALVTATVIQALPDLAMLNTLIDTWDVRIAILRDLPVLLDLMDDSRQMLRKARNSCKAPDQAAHMTREDVSRISEALSRQISSLGRCIDKMLDLLEGQDDALPQSWIDTLESLEVDLGSWRQEAGRIADENISRQQSQPEQTSNGHTDGAKSGKFHLQPKSAGLKVPSNAGHRREVSEVSIADSVLSDMSAGEVVDARKSQIFLPSQIQVVENSSTSPNRPPALHRASTASIEVVSKDQLKKFDVRRSMSAEMLSRMVGASSNTTPSRSLKEFAAGPPDQRTPRAELEAPDYSPTAPSTGPSSAMHSPSLVVPPLKVQTQDLSRNGADIPTLPRRSSKRASFGGFTTLSPIESSDIVSPVSPSGSSSRREPVSPASATRSNRDQGSLDSKIQDILEKLPNKIRLRDGDAQESQTSSNETTRSSTPTPALIPEMSKSSRRSSSAEPDIRVYHLHQNGHGRDSKPLKLFVRAVGENGERVMVRVGGGWADLAEYLREYSAHHGSRSASEGLLEVAQYPGKNDRSRKATSQIISPTQPRQPLPSAQRSRPRSLSNSSSGSRSRSPSPPPVDHNAPPPVPPIPASYTMYTPIMTVSTKPNGETETTFDDADPAAALAAKGRETLEPEVGPYSRTSSMHVPGVSTTTTVASPAAINPTKYTPLGGAGPKNAKSRSATYGAVPKEANDAWVEGMVGKARAVSSSTIHGPTTTTTTTVSMPASRRISSVPNPAPKEKATPPKDKVKAPESPADGQGVVRRKSRLGLGDVSGIRRVFLRRKSSK